MPAAKILNAADPRAIEEGAAIIRKGGLVAFPTETVYGLGADARNAMAVARLFEVKRRPHFDPLIVHVADSETAKTLGNLSSKNASSLMKHFWPGPLTLVVPGHASVPAIVTAGLDTVALRMPAHVAALALIRHSGSAIAAPSANPFGYVSPTEAQHVVDQLSDDVDLVLDGGRCTVGIESTIISLVGPRPLLLRAGGIPIEEIERLLGEVDRATAITRHPQAPGQLRRHYATRTPLEILSSDRDEPILRANEEVGILALQSPKHRERYAAVEVLSVSGNLREAAANLFAALRRLDNQGLDRLVAVPVPEVGLGIAIMDRLRRCSAS